MNIIEKKKEKYAIIQHKLGERIYHCQSTLKINTFNNYKHHSPTATPRAALNKIR